MRPLPVVNLAGLAVLWVAAFAALPSLPERIPVHFDLSGRPDAWSTSRGWWFFLPALATVHAGLLVLALPRWLERLARANSRWLNVPDAARFRALPEEARVRSLAPMRDGLQWISLEIQLLVALLMVAVLRGDRDLPLHPAWFGGGIALLLATVVAMTVQGVRAVKRETAAAANAPASGAANS